MFTFTKASGADRRTGTSTPRAWTATYRCPRRPPSARQCPRSRSGNRSLRDGATLAPGIPIAAAASRPGQAEASGPYARRGLRTACRDHIVERKGTSRTAWWPCPWARADTRHLLPRRPAASDMMRGIVGNTTLPYSATHRVPAVDCRLALITSARLRRQSGRDASVSTNGRPPQQRCTAVRIAACAETAAASRDPAGDALRFITWRPAPSPVPGPPVDPVCRVQRKA